MDTCVCNAHSLLTTLAPSGDVPVWWNPLGSAAIDAAVVGAYRAQASVGSPWGNAPANYAESLTNWANPGVNNLVEGNGAVPWAAATGWGFVAAALQYFDTGIVPTLNPVVYTIFVQYTAFTAGTLHGEIQTVGLNGALLLQTVGGMRSYHGTSASLVTTAPTLAAGNYGILAKQPYRNGVVDPVIPAGLGSTNLSLYIGGLNLNGAPAQYATANINAIAIYSAAAAFTAPDITAIAAVGGSMHNL